jgi:hypothetical protein
MKIPTAIAIAVLVFLYWFFILRPGRLDFWKIANKYPDEAYDFIQSEDCWMIFEDNLPNDYQSTVPKENWTGPFRLLIPKLGNRFIYIFGKYPDFKNSQNDFINKISQIT